jgi:hypothetical protein
MALNPAAFSGPMALDWAALTASLTTTPRMGAEKWAANYHTYASAAMSCAGVSPSVVNLPGLIDGIEAATKLPFDNPNATRQDIASAIASAHETYWTGALFGATGAVTSIGGTAALAEGLAALWATQTAGGLAITFPVSAASHAALLHAFTLTVMVKDTALPAPPGCGPNPIS